VSQHVRRLFVSAQATRELPRVVHLARRNEKVQQRLGHSLPVDVEPLLDVRADRANHRRAALSQLINEQPRLHEEREQRRAESEAVKYGVPSAVRGERAAHSVRSHAQRRRTTEPAHFDFGAP
jgi:hypothetical protein